MPVQKVSSVLVSHSAGAALLRARQGLVSEGSEAGVCSPSKRSFTQYEGPLASYRRTVELRPGPDELLLARQVVEFDVGIPWWSWLLALPLRGHLGRASPECRGTPWWGPPGRLGRRPAVVLAVLAALVAVQGFVGGLLPETLTYAAGEMHAGTLAQGAVFAAVELSALPALAALVLADRRGRRSVLVWATGGAVALSALGAAVPSVLWLALTQVAAGGLVAAGGIAAVVVAVEEVPNGCRAWSVGVLGMAGGFGAGVPLVLLPLAGTGPGGWRWLYALSLFCLPVVARAARQLPESQRWAPPGEEREAPAPHPINRRLILVCAGAALFALFALPAGQFQTEFLRDQRHYSALGISVLQQLSGTLGGLGVLVGGRLADTHGRRPVGIASVAGAAVATLAAYLAHGWAMWGATTVSQFFLCATVPVLGVYGAELFATRARARSAGLVAAASAVGGVTGLLAAGWLYARVGTLAPALAVLAAGPLVLAVMLALAYPESAGAPLDELSQIATPAPAGGLSTRGDNAGADSLAPAGVPARRLAGAAAQQ